jgi:signal peptidase I
VSQGATPTAPTMNPTRLVGFIAAAALLVAWFVLLRPAMLGGPATYATVSGMSMEPLFDAGDLVIARAEDSYAIGDVVVFRVPAGEPGDGSLVIHRIVGGDSVGGFVMKGDNRTEPDPWRPTAADIAGRSWVHVPAAGNPLQIARQPLVLAGFLGVLAFVAVMGSRSFGRRPSGQVAQSNDPAGNVAPHGRVPR